MLRAFITFNLVILNTMSLGIDTVDVVRYLRGDRGTLV